MKTRQVRLLEAVEHWGKLALKPKTVAWLAGTLAWASASSGFAQALYSIGVLSPSNPYSEVRALS